MPLILAALLLAAVETPPPSPRADPDAALRRMIPPGYPMPVRSPKIQGPIETVTLAPIYDAPMACVEHPAGQLGFLGDDLGADCLIQGGTEGEAGYPRLFRTDGKRNEDWYGWHHPVLAPLDGVVEFVWTNPVTNPPGKFGRPPASEVVIRGDDGVMVQVAHVDAVKVRKGDRVRAGEAIALVGNNGVARAPHNHVGAYRIADGIPLQIRWDQRAMAKLLGDEK